MRHWIATPKPCLQAVPARGHDEVDPEGSKATPRGIHIARRDMADFRIHVHVRPRPRRAAGHTAHTDGEGEDDRIIHEGQDSLSSSRDKDAVAPSAEGVTIPTGAVHGLPGWRDNGVTMSREFHASGRTPADRMPWDEDRPSGLQSSSSWAFA